MAAPLIAGNRLDTMSSQTISILTQPALLKVNQDPAGLQAVRVQVFGKRTNFSDVYGDPLARWEHEVWAKPLLLYPGQFIQWGFALALVNHGNSEATVTASMSALAKTFPKSVPLYSVSVCVCVCVCVYQYYNIIWLGIWVAW